MTSRSQDSAKTYHQEGVEYQRGLRTFWALKMAMATVSILTVSAVLFR